MKYQEAYNKLQSIIEKLKNEEISVDDMKKHVVQARKLVEQCQSKLREIENDLLGEE